VCLCIFFLCVVYPYPPPPPPDAQEEMVESGVIPEFAETVSEEGEDMVRRGERGRERMGKHSL